MFIITAECRARLIEHHSKRPWDEANAIIQELLTAPVLDPAAAADVERQQKVAREASMRAQLGVDPKVAPPDAPAGVVGNNGTGTDASENAEDA